MRHEKKEKKAQSEGNYDSLPPPKLVPVPHRNSKLTYLLKDSLGGNSHTIMITTLSTETDFYSQTLFSLNYSYSAKKIRNKANINQKTIADDDGASVESDLQNVLYVYKPTIHSNNVD